MILHEAVITKEENAVKITFRQGFINNGQTLTIEDPLSVIPFLSQLIGVELRIARASKKRGLSGYRPARKGSNGAT